MKRRTILANVAGVAAAGAAGCLASGSPGGGGDDDGTTTSDDDPGTTPDDPTTTPGDDPTTTPGDGPPDPADWNPSSRSPVETATLGSREGVPFPDNNRPHSVWVWNAARQDRTITLSVRAGGTTVDEREYEVPADGWVSVTLDEPATYDLVLAVDGERAGSVAVDQGNFDCNDSTTKVAVGPDGSVDSVVESTMVACAGPAVNGQSFARGGSDCGSRDDAEVEFRDEAVHVTGAVRTPDPCSDLALSSAVLESGERSGNERLAVTVTTDGSVEDVCVDCVGTVAYEASVEFRNDYPANVRVVHESMGDSRTVREVTR